MNIICILLVLFVAARGSTELLFPLSGFEDGQSVSLLDPEQDLRNEWRLEDLKIFAENDPQILYDLERFYHKNPSEGSRSSWLRQYKLMVHVLEAAPARGLVAVIRLRPSLTAWYEIRRAIGAAVFAYIDNPGDRFLSLTECGKNLVKTRQPGDPPVTFTVMEKCSEGRFCTFDMANALVLIEEQRLRSSS